MAANDDVMTTITLGSVPTPQTIPANCMQISAAIPEQCSMLSFMTSYMTSWPLLMMTSYSNDAAIVPYRATYHPCKFHANQCNRSTDIAKCIFLQNALLKAR